MRVILCYVPQSTNTCAVAGYVEALALEVKSLPTVQQNALPLNHVAIYYSLAHLRRASCFIAVVIVLPDLRPLRTTDATSRLPTFWTPRVSFLIVSVQRTILFRAKR